MAAETSQGAASSSTPRYSYDVFFNFRGEDTRRSFTDHLHSALKRKGIIVFRDDEKLRRGRNIRPELLTAIPESEYAVVIVSENFASSTWCLDELSEIVKCKREKGLKVLPVFYEVDPSNVRKQKGSFGTALAKHAADNIDEKRRKMWRDALEEICSISGWDTRGRLESEVVDEICIEISNGLSRRMSEIDNDLVGMESGIEELMNLLFIRGNDVGFIGIWGMGGIGKTKLAQGVYSKVSSQFEASCFISDVRKESQKYKSLFPLQRQLISRVLGQKEPEICNAFEGQSLIASRLKNKKVFIVLDDVDKEDQFEELVGKPDWFGKGSRILITSRNRQLLKRHVDEIYNVKKLTFSDALQLFNLNAFKQRCYKGNYEVLSHDIVKHAGGLPLALKVFGSFLFGSTRYAWENALDRLKAELDSDIFNILQISYEELGNLQKRLFLDIACFFKGELVSDVIYKLKALGHFPENDIPILESRALIMISKNNVLEMHDLVQQMGHQIVQWESSREHGKCSRLWSHEDIIHVLNKNTGSDAVEAIFLKLPLPKPMELNLEGLSKMKRLRMLMIRPISFNKNDVEEYLSTIKWYGDPLEFMISNELCVLEWWGYPLEYLPASFEPNNLVELKMPMSNIKELWGVTKNVDKLKYINLSDSKNSIEMLDFSRFPNLEELCGGGSSSRSTTFSLSHLALFLKFLKKLELIYCGLSDEALPSDFGCLSLLEHLNLSGNNFTRINDLSQLSKLTYLELNDCSRLKELPPNFSLSLSGISLRNCRSLDTFSKPRDVWSSSEVLVAGDSSVVATYFGYNGRQDRTLHLAQPYRGSNMKSSGIEMAFEALSWGRTLKSDIPEWFNKRSSEARNICGRRICQLYSDTFDGGEILNSGIMLFIVYEVFECNGHQNKKQKIDNSSCGIFPVFNLNLEVYEDGKHPSDINGTWSDRNGHIVIRVPEVPSCGRNGVWVIVSRACFSQRNYVWSSSIIVSSPNVRIKEFGARVLWNHPSEGCEISGIIRSISPHDLASECAEKRFYNGSLSVYGPIKRATAGRGSESPENGFFYNKAFKSMALLKQKLRLFDNEASRLMAFLKQQEPTENCFYNEVFESMVLFQREVQFFDNEASQFMALSSEQQRAENCFYNEVFQRMALPVQQLQFFYNEAYGLIKPETANNKKMGRGSGGRVRGGRQEEEEEWEEGNEDEADEPWV